MSTFACRFPPVSKSLASFVTLACACLLFGAIPFLSVPTLGQAIWASGFAQSYANAETFTVYATDFGLPNPAPIAFGLSATLVQGLLIRLFDVHTMDAYTLAVVLYLALALAGAAALARSLGASFHLALVIGLLWLAVPVVWEHVGYSMVALGFALLPFYLHSANRLFVAHDNRIAVVSAGLGFCLACIIAVFMDGYTFVMFFVAASIVWVGNLVTREQRRQALLFALPCMAAGFLLSYLLYMAFIGGHRYTVYPIEFARGWGVDVTMLLAPTRGIHWLWDTLGLSVARDSHMFWGDASVWMTTFVAPIFLSGVVGFAIAKDRKHAVILLAIAIAGIYMSLGPSLKIHSTKQVPGISQAESGPLMPARYALGPTGSGMLSMHVPGFREMRASYRWIGLGVLGLWALTAILLVRIHARWPALAYATASLLIVLLAPHVKRTVHDAIVNRQKADAMTQALARDLREAANGSGTLFFAPHGNDFIVNYLAATAGFKSYNIGGDKNAEMALLAWSEPMRNMGFSNLPTSGFQDDLRTVLLMGETDAVILPYFDTLYAALVWPPTAASIRALQEQRLPIARESAISPCFRVREFPLFAAVSLSESGRREQEKVAFDATYADIPPDVLHACQLRK